MNLVMIVLALNASTVLPQASPLPSPSLSPPASAAPASPLASGSPLPVVSGPPLPAASGSAAPSATPSASTTSPASTTAATTAPESYKYRFVPRQPAHPAPGVPQIFAVYLNSDTLTSTGPISIKVTTSPDVVKVVSHSGSHEGVIPRVVPGDFEANSKLPKVPFIASGMTLDLEFIATGPAGQKTSVNVPVKLK